MRKMFTDTEHSGVLPTPASLTRAPGGKSDHAPTRWDRAEPRRAWTCIPHPQPAPPSPGQPGSRSALRSAPHRAVPSGLCPGCSRKLLLTRSLFLRMGVPAPGDRLPGDLPVPSLDAVCAAQGHPHVPGRRVGLPVADFQNHAWSGEYNLHPLTSGGGRALLPLS